jgi:hypothetical protein
MDFGDCDNNKGYYILDLNDLSYNFYHNNVSPRYKKLNLSELVQMGTITEGVKTCIANNFVKLKIDKNISQDDITVLQTILNQLKPNTLLIDYDINCNKIITDTTSYDFSGIDITQAIEEFVNLLDIDDKKSILEHTLNLYNKCTIT